MTIQVIPHQINGYAPEGDLMFSMTETDPTVCRIEIKSDHHTLESWREFSAAIEKAFQMFKEADKP